MTRLIMSAAALILLVVLCGCCHTELPCWSHPGSEDVQVHRALRYDPYPETDVGPAGDGVRPREYDQPPPEPSRARWQLNGWQ
jgi:hypothetical protein